ncbi:ATP-binding protein [Streptomyces sp. 8N616]|uniref:ATP-binding protein n=1 Tax=Streptomyces sp. 8N616 TaxID=3457414 RepID=UPI003FD1C329
MQVLQVQLEVRPDPAEVGRARRWARSRLAGSGIGPDEPLAETLILLISELVTNAVVHTGCPAVLRMQLPDVGAGAAAARAGTAGSGAAGAEAAGSGAAGAEAVGSGAARAGTGAGTGIVREAARETVRVEVADRSAHAPKPRHAEGDDTNGRGLELVTGLADRWGWHPEGGGKRIWCEVDRAERKPVGQPMAQPVKQPAEQPVKQPVVQPVRRSWGTGVHESQCAVTNRA